MAEEALTTKGQNLIAGEWSSAGSSTFRAIDPRTEKPLGPMVSEATPQEVREAAMAARSAFSTFRSWSEDQRAQLLVGIADRLEELRRELVAVADRETALGTARLEGELGRTTGQLRLFARWIGEGWHHEAIIDTSGPDVRRSLLPVGPVAIFGASNFPLAFGVPGGDTASALAAGCPVVAKGHPSHPGTSELTAGAITDACLRAGAPAGAFSLVQGASTEVGQALVTAPEIKAVGFTGSLAGGRALADLAAQRDEPIPVFAEMGSLNPVFVFGVAAKKRRREIAAGFAESMTMGTGQFCTKPGVLVVPADERGDELVEALADELGARASGPMLNPRIASAYRQETHRLTSRSDVEVVRRVGCRPNAGPLGEETVLLRVDVDTFLEDADLHAEHFGPVTVVVRCPVERYGEVAQGLTGSLTATIHTEGEDREPAANLQRTLADRVGRVIHDGYPTGVAVAPAMHHGGPYPATTRPDHTSVGATAIRRFLRPIAYQDAPDALLPPELRDANPLGLLRLVDWAWTSEPVERPE